MAPPEPAADSREMEANSSEEFILRLDGSLNEEEMSHWQPRTAYQPDNLVDSAMADNEPLFPPHKCKGKTHIFTCHSSVPNLTIILTHIAIFFRVRYKTFQRPEAVYSYVFPTHASQMGPQERSAHRQRQVLG